MYKGDNRDSDGRVRDSDGRVCMCMEIDVWEDDLQDGLFKGGMMRKKRRKSVRWSAVPVPCLSRLRLKLRQEVG